ncbi:MAG: SAM-dependent chlorinase/fluorinase [Dehalococcoidia bacterium]
MPRPSGIVTLTTDFGLSDAYVAQLHAVVLREYPAARIVDVSHAVPPGSLDATLFLTEAAWPHFPPGTVHLVVVDPGVGSDRRIVAIDTGRAFLVGPDTGVLSSGLADNIRPAAGTAMLPLKSGPAAVDIRESPLRAERISATFHGRDIMAPVAARLAAGDPLADLGAPIDQVAAAAPLAARIEGGEGDGRILHIDRFGNAISNIRTADAPAAFELALRDASLAGPAATYRDGVTKTGDRAVVIGGSSGYLEIAWPNGSAAQRLRLKLGDQVRIRPRPASPSGR